MQDNRIQIMRRAHTVLKTFSFPKVTLEKGYANRTLRIDLTTNAITIHPVSQQMKDLWTGGKGFDLWLMAQEITKDTTWNSPENPLCFATGPLGGTTSFPGSGKTIVTAISPITNIPIDCNVGGFFGPYFKFAGFDALCIVGKASMDVIILIDAVTNTISIEQAPLESSDSHTVSEELTLMYADDELDMRNISIVSTGRGAEHTRMGVLNFSFWDWRRGVARLKQAGRGGVGRVFRDKKIRALIAKNKNITPAWRIQENKASKSCAPKKIILQNNQADIDQIHTIINTYDKNPTFLFEMMLALQERFHVISKTAVDILTKETKVPKSRIYHIATFYKCFSLEKKGKTTIQVCTGSACKAKGADQLIAAIEKHLGISCGQTTKDGTFTLETASCLGACEIAPVLAIGKRIIGTVDPNDIPKLLQDNRDPSEKKESEHTVPVNVFALPSAVVTQKSDASYKNIQRLLSTKTKPEDIILCIKESGLVGRGGGGFPTGEKWELCRHTGLEKNIQPVVVCNASLADTSDHLVIEGMLICGYAINASVGHVSFRLEHELAMKRFQKTLEEVRARGFLGKHIAGSSFSFDIIVHRQAGGFVSGESSALLQTFTGTVGEPHAKYIHASQSGLANIPSVVNNRETFANIPLIIENGKAWRGLHDFTTPGTKVIFLSGDIKQPGFVEVPFGISIHDIVEKYGRGAPHKKRSIKAVQIGGSTGGFLPKSLFDCALDYQSLITNGTILGSGAFIVKDNRQCMVESTYAAVDFLLDETCGKCTPCREGLMTLHTILSRIQEGAGTQDDISRMQEICIAMKETSICGLGQDAGNPVLTLLTYFKNEVEEHILHKKCMAGKCKTLSHYTIIPNKCTGCTLCAKKCPVHAITGIPKETHIIDPTTCIRCGICLDICNFEAVEVK